MPRLPAAVDVVGDGQTRTLAGRSGAGCARAARDSGRTRSPVSGAGARHSRVQRVPIRRFARGDGCATCQALSPPGSVALLDRGPACTAAQPRHYRLSDGEKILAKPLGTVELIRRA